MIRSYSKPTLIFIKYIDYSLLNLISLDLTFLDLTYFYLSSLDLTSFNLISLDLSLDFTFLNLTSVDLASTDLDLALDGWSTFVPAWVQPPTTPSIRTATSTAETCAKSREANYFSSSSHFNNNEVQSRSGVIWKRLQEGQSSKGRFPSENAFTPKLGPTAYSCRQVMKESPLIAFQLFIDETMLRLIQKYKIHHARFDDKNFNCPLEELEKFIILPIARGVLERKILQ